MPKFFVGYGTTSVENVEFIIELAHQINLLLGLKQISSGHTLSHSIGSFTMEISIVLEYPRTKVIL